MKNDQYIPHEVSMRSNSQVINLIEAEGAAGYGFYWALLEYLRAQNHYTGDIRAIKNIARQMKIRIDKAIRVLNDYGLFVVENTLFSSPMLIEKMLPSGLSEYFFFDGESMIADLRVKGRDSAGKLRKENYLNAGGLSLIDEFSERAVFLIDNEKLTIPEAVNIISKDLVITDLSLEADNIENTVASLYKEFGV